MTKPFEWPVSTPEKEGMDGAKLARLQEDLAARRTAALLIVKNDRIVLEWYAEGVGPQSPLGTASLAKGLVGGMALITAVEDGYIELDQKACKYIPAWRDDPVKAKITIRQLICHTSGIEDAEEPGKRHEELAGWKGAFWAARPRPVHYLHLSGSGNSRTGHLPRYSNPGYAALAYALTAALQKSPYKDIEQLLRERIMRPIGVADDEWSIGYEQKYMIDGLPLVATWGGGKYTARAAARVGRLLLRKGDWEGKRVLKEESVRMALGDTGEPIDGPGGRKSSGQGLGWGTNSTGLRAPLPRDAFWGHGAGHKILMVVPSLDLIIYRGGKDLAPGDFGPVQEYLANPTMTAITTPGGTS